MAPPETILKFRLWKVPQTQEHLENTTEPFINHDDNQY